MEKFAIIHTFADDKKRVCCGCILLCLAPLLHRNDQAIDQIIRNIVSHKNDSSRNIIYRGLVEYDDGVWEITDRGRDVFEQGMKRRYERELN